MTFPKNLLKPVQVDPKNAMHDNYHTWHKLLYLTV